MSAMPKYSVGPMGHYLRLRKLMARVSVTAKEWCNAFDAGDEQALEHLGNLLDETFTEMGAAAGEISKAAKAEGREP